MRNKKLTVLSLVVLLSLLTSLVFPIGVLADDSTPPSTEVPGVVTPPEETPTPEPTADAAAPEIVSTQEAIATEAAVSNVATPEPTVDAGSTASDVSLLSQLPENTEVVVSNADGVVVPLGSQEAADIIAVQDPLWCPAGQAPTPGANGCTTNFPNSQALIDAMDASNPNNSNSIYEQNGIIYFTVNPGSGSFTLIRGNNSGIDNADYDILRTFNLILQGGWNGTSGSTTFTQTDFGANPLTIGSTGNPWVGNITLNNFSFSGVSSTNAVTVYTTNGGITLNNVVVNNQAGSGGNRYNTTLLDSSGNGNIVVQNSFFDGNNTTSENRGFSATTNNGSISISNTTFQDAIRNSGGSNYDGATLSARTITLTNVTAQNNDGNGIVIDNNPNSVTVNNSSFLNNGEWGFNTDMGNRPLTFNNTSFSGNTSGAYNYNGNSLTTSCTAPKVWIAGVGCLLDTIPPTISAAVTAGPNPNGWYRSNVTVHFTCADPGGSGIAACPADQILSAEGASVSSTARTVTDNAGNVSALSNVITVKIDKTPPTIVVAVNPAPTAGWNNTTPVTVSFTCADNAGGSGVATCPVSQSFNNSGIVFPQRATDLAGNQSNGSDFLLVRIDKTIPTISAAVTAGPNGSSGWYRSNVTVRFTCADNFLGSGIATCPADQILSTDGASVSSTAQTVTDNAGNVSAASNVITVKIDKTLPTIVAAATTSPTAAGWYNANVIVHFTCTDGTSGIVSCPADQLLTASGTSTAQTVTDNAGNVSAASNTVAVKIDKTIPTISAAITAGTLGTNGWYKSDVTIHFTCTDADSGIASCPADQILSTDGASVSSTAQTAIDNAGNVSAASNVITVKIDKTLPTIVAAATTSPTAAGWYNANVIVHFTCTDGTSGIVSCPADQLLTASGTSTAQTVTDNAGNVSAASNTVAVKIDKTIPTISAAITAGTLGTNGWYKSDVTIHFTCTDADSGIASCPADQLLTASGTSAAQTTTDNAGNVSAASNMVAVNIDKTIPTISAAITAGTPGTNGWYKSDVTVHFTCTDGGSDIASCPADQVLTASGTSTAQTATDNAGNVSAASNVITVKIDKTAPSASANATPAPNANGWNNTDVTVNFSGTDVGSGIASCTAPVTLSTEGPGQSASGTCIDIAGNVSNIASANNINIDKTEPIITVPANITDEATGASGATVNYTVTVKDNLDGGITVSCIPVSGSTFAIATTTVSCNSTDQAGNAASSTFTVTVQDTTSPIVTVPSNITMEATSSSGATVNFTASAADIVDGPLTPTCSPVSGSVFALGTTTISCSATDFAKNTSTSTFTVTVQDTTPPAIESHADIKIDTRKASGVILSYNTPNTLDAVDGAGTANCQPSSGSLFPVGHTTVTCRAIDRHGNSSASTFVIYVEEFKKDSIDTQAGFVPVTGVPTALSCAKPSTILRMAGFEVTFTSLCGYSAVLTEAPEGSLFGALPAGSKYVSGLDIALTLNGDVINTLPAGTTSTLSFGTTGESLVILYWDPAASAWVEKSVTIENGKVILAINMPGTYVLVDKSTTTSMKDNSPVVTTLNSLYLAVMDFFKQSALQ